MAGDARRNIIGGATDGSPIHGAPSFLSKVGCVRAAGALLPMRRLLPEEIDAAVQEVERLKAALSCSTDGESYLGMRGGVEKDRQVLCSLLHLAMQALDRLREKEIEVLKAASAAATATGKFARLGEERVSHPRVHDHL